MKIKLPSLVGIVLGTLTIAASAFAQGTAFTYQGHLTDNANPANGTYDFRYELHNDAITNGLLGSPLNHFSVIVSNGLFTSRLDFGPGWFSGEPRWLQILVRSNGGAVFGVL